MMDCWNLPWGLFTLGVAEGVVEALIEDAFAKLGSEVLDSTGKKLEWHKGL